MEEVKYTLFWDYVIFSINIFIYCSFEEKTIIFPCSENLMLAHLFLLVFDDYWCTETNELISMFFQVIISQPAISKTIEYMLLLSASSFRLLLLSVRLFLSYISSDLESHNISRSSPFHQSYLFHYSYDFAHFLISTFLTRSCSLIDIIDFFLFEQVPIYECFSRSE